MLKVFGELPPLVELAQMFEVSQSVIINDIKFLKSQGHIHKKRVDKVHCHIIPSRRNNHHGFLLYIGKHKHIADQSAAWFVDYEEALAVKLNVITGMSLEDSIAKYHKEIDEADLRR